MTCNKELGRLILFPITIGADESDHYLPKHNLTLLAATKYFVVENSRTARQFFKSVLPQADISSLTFYQIDKHKGYSYEREEVLALLRAGHDVGLMSEAGCPAVADPGHLVVRDCHKAGVEVVPLIGPSSILLSLMASGFNGQEFTFHGYLPHDRQLRTKTLLRMQERVDKIGETQIFIEAPYRNDQLIDDLTKVLPKSRLLSMSVDLTTKQAESRTLTLAEWKQLRTEGATWHKRPAIFLLGKE